jgi:hypothetical protein
MARQPCRLPSQPLGTRQRSHGQSLVDPCADARIAGYKGNAILHTLKLFSSAPLTFSRVERTERLVPLSESSRRPRRNSFMYSVARSALLCFIAGGSPFAIAQVHMTRPITRGSQVPSVTRKECGLLSIPTAVNSRPRASFLNSKSISTAPGFSRQLSRAVQATRRRTPFLQISVPTHGLQSPSPTNRLGRQRSECAGALLCQLWK